MLIPPAWTLGIELMFYALVPFLVRLGTKWLVAILVVSVVLRQSYSYFSLLGPWTSFSSPFVICFFIIGMLSYRLGKVTGAASRSVSTMFLIAVLAELVRGSTTGCQPLGKRRQIFGLH
jgi:peptidoglycan/LPS O-acetylase OafA/YrhL